MKKAIVIDWLDKYGGAERVIGTFEKVFSFDEVYTLINIMEDNNIEEIFPNKNNIHETFLRILGKNFRIFFFSFHFFIKKIKIKKDIDLIISSSHAVAKGVKKSNLNQVHISYFQARNFNYIWSDYGLYFGKFRFLIYPLIAYLRRIDIKQSQNPDYIISNSIFVQKWVKEKYNRDSKVIYPPVDLSSFPLEIEKEDYYVVVGRLVYVKRFDIAIKAFSGTRRKLIIIGGGAQEETLKNMAVGQENIIFTGFLNSKQVSKYIQKAKAFIQTGVEGFGIAPIEAQACGTPVIAFSEGGVLETVIENETGVFFQQQNVDSLAEAIEKFEKMNFDSVKIRENALIFSKERFEKEIKIHIEELYKSSKLY